MHSENVSAFRANRTEKVCAFRANKTQKMGDFTAAHIIRQIGHCMGGNFNIHIWAWSASPSVPVGRL